VLEKFNAEIFISVPSVTYFFRWLLRLMHRQISYSNYGYKSVLSIRLVLVTVSGEYSVDS